MAQVAMGVQIDFEKGFLLMGYDGPFRLKIAEGRAMLRGLGLELIEPAWAGYEH